MLTAAMNKTIAPTLSFSFETVEHHLSAALRKHDVRNQKHSRCSSRHGLRSSQANPKPLPGTPDMNVPSGAAHW